MLTPAMIQRSNPIRRAPPWRRLLLGAALALLPVSGASGQEVGAFAAWLAQDVDGMRGLKGGGAYVAVPVMPSLDLRLELTAAGRSRLRGPVLSCTGTLDAPSWCLEEPVERESRVTALELGAVAWTRPVVATRFGFGAAVVRHGVSIADQSLASPRRHELTEGRDAFGASVSVHVRAMPSFSPGALAFASAGRSFVQHGRCGAEPDVVVCGGSGTFTLRAGVGYRFGARRR